jgi:hypothetical protein
MELFQDENEVMAIALQRKARHCSGVPAIKNNLQKI